MRRKALSKCEGIVEEMADEKGVPVTLIEAGLAVICPSRIDLDMENISQ